MKKSLLLVLFTIVLVSCLVFAACTLTIPNGENGKDGITPQLKIDGDNYWYVSYDNGTTWNSLGVKATGADGENGTDGITPKLKIGVDNYWCISYDSGKTWASLGVKAIGSDGEQGPSGENGIDGVTPQLKIGEDNYWYVSYDNGVTWASLGTKATGADGEQGPAGENGTDGVTPQLKVGEDNYWYVSYDNGSTWTSLGVEATGANGENGIDGITPQINVGEDNYWYVSYDDGSTWACLGVKATGNDGADGVTPQLKIGEDNYWYISYDNGATWASLGTKATGADGEQGPAGEDGTDGVSIVSSAFDENGNMVITYSDGTTQIVEHTWQELYTIIQPGCLTDGKALYSCTDCNLVRVVDVEKTGHDYVSVITSPTCTEQGYTTHACGACGDSYEDTYTDALGHNFEHIVVEATCAEDGVSYQKCSGCDERKDIVYTDRLKHQYGDEDFVIVEPATCSSEGVAHAACLLCGDIRTQYISKTEHQYVPVFQDGKLQRVCSGCNVILEDVEGQDNIVVNCPTDWTFKVVSTLDKQKIADSISIIDAYFQGTEYEEHEDVVVDFSLEKNDETTYTVVFEEDLEPGRSYLVRLSEDVYFYDYLGTELIFILAKEETANVVYNEENIKFLAKMEQESPGYNAVEDLSKQDEDYLYYQFDKVDGINIDAILCIGNVMSAEDLLSDNPDNQYVFGKVSNIEQQNGKYLVTLSCPEMEEVFTELEVYSNQPVNMEEHCEITDEMVADIEEQLKNDEDFIAFAVATRKVAERYAKRNHVEVLEESNKSFLDGIKFDTDISVKGLYLYAVISGEISIPLITKYGQEFGKISVGFKVSATFEYEVQINYELKGWLIKRVKYLDMSVTQTSKFVFEFGVDLSIHFDASSAEIEDDSEEFLYSEDYAYNTESGVIHYVDCKHHTKIKDKSKVLYISAMEVQELIEEGSGRACLICRPTEGLDNSILVINTSNRKFHCHDCYYVGMMNEDNKEYTDLPVNVLDTAGYEECDWCQPSRAERINFEEQLMRELLYTDWSEEIEKIKEYSNSADISGSNKSEVTIAHLEWPIYCFSINLDIQLVFDFDLQASLSYKYEVSKEVTFGVILSEKELDTYKLESPVESKQELTLAGKAEVKAGVGIRAYASITGCSKWLQVGIHGEVGIYGILSGVLHVSSAENDNYAAAYFEMGMYYDVDLYAKFLWFKGELTIVEGKIPFVKVGYDKAYFSYSEYLETINLTDTRSYALKDLLWVDYYDLINMTTKKEQLLWNNDKGDYEIIFTLQDGTNCHIENGRIIVDAKDAFTDKLTITIKANHDWSEYSKGRGVFYLEAYEIDLIYDGCDHKYEDVVTAQTCTEQGYTTHTCTNCGDSYVDTYIDAGHDEIVHQAKSETCTEIGWDAYVTCTRCDYTTYVEIPATGHKILSITTPPTCTEQGYTTHSCSNCNNSWVDTYVASLGHIWNEGKITTQPKCTEVGIRTYTCKRTECGHTITEEIPALGHDSFFHEAKAATCTEIGWDAYVTCNRNDCEYTTYKEIPPTGHNFTTPSYVWADDYSACTATTYCSNYCEELGSYCGESKVAEATATITIILATCTEKGSITYTATFAEAEFTIQTQVIDIEALGHNYEDGVCTQCGDEQYTTSLIFALSDDETYYIVTGLEEDCEETDIVIPSIYEGKPVTSISLIASPFSYSISITSITIPSSITNINPIALIGCVGLTNINVDKDNQSYKTVDGNLYSNDGSVLIKYATGKSDTSFTIPSSVTTIGFGAFWTCQSLTNITIPYSVTTIDGCAFEDCTSLTSIPIPSSVTTIGGSAFYGCTSLESITIPSSVTSIGRGAFEGCPNLTSITIPFVGATLNGTTDTHFGYIFGAPNYGYNESYVPTSLNTVVITGGKSISSYAFRSCSLNNIIISEGVTSIGDEAFRWCYSLRNITIPEGVTSIGESAFSYCTGLTSITIPSSVTSIGEDAFIGCHKLVEVCNKSSLTITVGDSSYGDVGYYAKHIITDEADTALINVGDYIFYDDGTDVYLVDYVGDDIELTLSDYEGKDYAINQYAFYSNGILTGITIPTNVTSIGKWAFAHCDRLITVTLEEGGHLESIGHNAFVGCTNLIDVTFEDESCWFVTSTQGATTGTYLNLSDASQNATYLKDTYSNSAWYATEHIEGEWIVDVEATCTTNGSRHQVCANCGTTIKTEIIEAPGHNYENNVCTVCGDTLYSWRLIYTLSEDETYYIVDGYDINAMAECSEMDVVIPPIYNDLPVISIDEDAFYNCTNLISITIPSSVTSIGDLAFSGCTGLTNITIPSGVTSIGWASFSGCKNLTKIIIPASVTSIGEYAFSYCESLTSITIPSSVTSIGNAAFERCTSLISVILEERSQLESIGSYAFYDCTNLTNITIPSSVIDIGSYAFYNCDNLTSITIPNGVISICDYVFEDCTNLTSITISSSVTNIGRMAFYNCIGLTTVYYTGTKEQWNSIIIDLWNDCFTSATIHYNYTGEEN